MKHQYFKTRTSKGINVKTFDPLYFPQISLARGKWDWILDCGEIVVFDNKAEAEKFCKTLIKRNKDTTP